MTSKRTTRNNNLEELSELPDADLLRLAESVGTGEKPQTPPPEDPDSDLLRLAESVGSLDPPLPKLSAEATLPKTRVEKHTHETKHHTPFRSICPAENTPPDANPFKKRSRGATQNPYERSVFWAPAHVGRWPHRDIEELLAPKSITVWFDGDIILKDLNEPLPDHVRNKDLDPDEITSTYEMICWYVELVHTSANPLTVRYEEISPDVPAFPRGAQRRRWSNKQVKRSDYIQYLTDHPGATLKQIADAFFGPFQSEAAKTNAHVKVRTILQRMRNANMVTTERPDPDDVTRLVGWHALVPPDQADPTRLSTAPKPEPKLGRIRLRIIGRTMVHELWEDKHADLANLQRIVEPLGLRARIYENDPTDTDSPLTVYKPPRRSFPHQRRVDHLIALDMVNEVRKGAFNLENPPRYDDVSKTWIYTPMLCYFSHWARMLYRPPATGSGSVLDMIMKDAPLPTVEEQRYFEQKAFKLMRTLEKKHLVVRRHHPDGRSILFSVDDAEARKFPATRG